MTNQQLHPEALLWKCQVRLEFLTTLAFEEPDLVKRDSILTGFREVLMESQELLGLAIKKMNDEEATNSEQR